MRRILIRLAKFVLGKHQPKIIIIFGDGPTASLREYLYAVIKEKYPVRRNLEFPEAEFSIPLTIFGNFPYPISITEWLTVILKTAFLAAAVKPHRHFLILEMACITPEIFNLWIKILKPNTIVGVGKLPTGLDIQPTDLLDSPAAGDNDLKQLAQKVAQTYGLSRRQVNTGLAKANLPLGRIRLLPGQNGSLIVDSTYYHRPPPLSAVWEMIATLPGRKILFSQVSGEEKNYPPQIALVNPKNYQPQKEDTIIIRGRRPERLDQLRNLARYPLRV